MIAEQAPIAEGLSHPPTLQLYRMKARLEFGYLSQDMLKKLIHMRNKKESLA
ncbi:hypothetical protein P5633_22145 [Bacillus subtilis]|uniref:Uncharacterized protein n=1 Tax=Bacillus subtilis TaxID=1423 RepID=A0AC62A4A3_BACIU